MRLNQQQLEGIGRPAEEGTRVTSTQEWEKWRGSQGPERKQTKIGLVREQRPSVKIKPPPKRAFCQGDSSPEAGNATPDI